MHQFLDFKGFADASVDLFRPLTVLIGPNGVGKTNLIEGVELLAYLSSGQPLHTVTDVGRGGGFEIRGGLQSCPRRPATECTLGYRATMEFEGRQVLVEYAITLGVMPAPRVLSEVLAVDGRKWIDAVHSGGALLTVTYDDFERAPDKPSVTLGDHAPVLPQYESITTRNKKRDVCVAFVRNLAACLRRAYVFDPSPRLMRDYDRVGNNVLLRDGASLSAVLYALSVGTPKQRSTLDRIRDRIRQLPEEPFDQFGFEVTKLNDVIFGFTRPGDSTLVDARLLSDGTLRTLAVLVALETCDVRSRVVVEEFDNGVHPSRVAMLAEALTETANRRTLSVLVTTHNPATLNALTPEQLDGVVVAHWLQARGSAVLTPLRQVPNVQDLLASGRLGDLVTRRVVDSYLQTETDEARAAATKHWLEALP
jgi:predicted ATPase